MSRDRTADRVRGLLDHLTPHTATEPVTAFASATDDEVFALIDAELGSPLPGLEERSR